MRRPKEPWYRSYNDTWYICLNGKQIPLAKGEQNKEEAYRAFYKLMALDEPIPQAPKQFLVITILDLFLDHSKRHNKPETYDWYRRFLQSFSDVCGKLSVDSLKPFHVSRWLDSHKDWTTARRAAIVCVKRAFNWAADEGLIDKNPIKSIKKPPMPRRERILTRDEQQLIFENAGDDAFRDLLIALRETGARPGEISRVTAENVDLENGVWILQEHKTKGKVQKPRIIYLTPLLLDRTKKLIDRHPTGPLFRNSQGNPWNRNAIRDRFRRLRKKLGLSDDVVAYLYRHSYATDALENGVPPASVAELLGHTNLRMVAEHYAHLTEKRQHLRQMAQKATASDDPS